MVEFGTILIDLANVLMTKYGLQEHACLLKLLVQMEEYGIQLFMLVHVLQALILILTSVIQFPLALMVKSIIL